ncbi:MAG: hypothetical protein Kow00106_16990 [Anaerolineae bacterium]
MKRITLVIVLVGVLTLSAALPAFAEGNGPASGRTCGQFFGQHVAEHAQAGHLGQEHNPGMHQGLANFLDHGQHEHSCP